MEMEQSRQERWSNKELNVESNNDFNDDICR